MNNFLCGIILSTQSVVSSTNGFEKRKINDQKKITHNIENKLEDLMSQLSSKQEISTA